jgi:hypothetical protein
MPSIHFPLSSLRDSELGSHQVMSAIVEQPDLNTMEEILPKDQLLLPVTEAYSKASAYIPEYFITFGGKTNMFTVFIGSPDYCYTTPAVALKARSTQDVKSATAFAKSKV